LAAAHKFALTFHRESNHTAKIGAIQTMVRQGAYHAARWRRIKGANRRSSARSCVGEQLGQFVFVLWNKIHMGIPAFCPRVF
jgi:hypothetical protein